MITDYKLDPPDDLDCIRCGDTLDETALDELNSVISIKEAYDYYCTPCKREVEDEDEG